MGDLIKTYPSISAAARELGSVRKKGNIGLCLQGKKPTMYGYKWQYC